MHEQNIIYNKYGRFDQTCMNKITLIINMHEETYNKNVQKLKEKKTRKRKQKSSKLK